ncbi:uncharacterized protein LOC144865180 [Branchiostoma floridae x Branchiostoma japonicum]
MLFMENRSLKCKMASVIRLVNKMAAAHLSLAEGIREELTCSICLELFTRPKVLPCGHTFCQDCLQDHASRRVPLQCPVCRRQVRLPLQGVAGLPDSHIIANMCERLQQQTSLSGETREQPQSGNRCSFHPSTVLKLYCKQCLVPVCEQCLEEAHDDHRTTTIKKAAQQRISTVQALMKEGRNIMESYLSFLRSLRGEEKALNETKQQTDNSIIQAYNQMMQKLTDRKNHLLSERGEKHKKNLDRIQTERDRVLVGLNEISAACDQAEQEMQQGWVEILSQQSALTEVVGKYRRKAAPTPVQNQPAAFQPTDTPVPVLGHVTGQSLPSAPIREAPAPIPAAPASSNDAGCRGGHHHGNQSQGGPQSQKVTFGGLGSGPGQFDCPRGVTVSDKREMFVADCGNQRIQVFSLQGTFVRQFPTVVSGGQNMEPHDVVMDRAWNLWVVGRIDNDDNDEFAVQYNRQDGTLVRIVGQQQEMKYPWYITVDGEGNIIVSDWDNHRVYVFNKDGKFLFKFGGEGSREGQLYNPLGICTDSAGNIIVADSGNSRVEMFDKTGKFLKHITTDMMKPRAVAMATKGPLQATLSEEEREQSENRCSSHPSEEFKVYCKQCQIPICELCLEEDHNGHGTTTIKKAAQEKRDEAKALIAEGRDILEGYCSFIRGLRETEKTLHEEKQQTDNRIIQACNTLLSEVEHNHRKNLERVHNKRESVLADVNELSAACDRAEQEMEKREDHFLSQESNLTEVVGKYRGKAALTPVQTQPAVFQPVLGHVTVQFLPSAPIPAAHAPIPAAHAAGGTGHHHGNQRPEEHRDQRVTFGGEGSGIGQFDYPAGLTVSDDGEIFVTDRGNQRIQVFTLQGTFVRQFPTVVPGGQKIDPQDLATDEEGNLWVVGRAENDEFAVQYTKQGRVLRKFDLQYTMRWRGVAVDTRRNHILITQTTGDWPKRHGEIQVFWPDGTLVRTVGQQQGMEYPCYITVDGEGNILVSDCENHHVYVYSEEGKFLFKFGGEGNGEGQLKGPHGICTDGRGNIVVADMFNSRVEMFDKTGRFLKHITADQWGPEAVAMATQGQLVVTNYANDTVTIFPNS